MARHLVVLTNEHWDDPMVFIRDSAEAALDAAETYARECEDEWRVEPYTDETWAEYTSNGEMPWSWGTASIDTASLDYM